MKEQYLVIEPSGEIRWEEIKKDELHERMHEIIDCDMLEEVRTVIRPFVLIVDDCGRIKTPPKPHNELASRLYAGYHLNGDDIVGTAILAGLKRVEPYGELDWSPTGWLPYEALEALGIKVPEQK